MPDTTSNNSTTSATASSLPAPLSALKTDLSRSLLQTGDFDRLNTFLLDRLHESGWYESTYDLCLRTMRLNFSPANFSSSSSEKDKNEGGEDDENEDDARQTNGTRNSVTAAATTAAATASSWQDKNVKAEESAKSYREVYERVETDALKCVDANVKDEICKRIREVLVGGGYVVEG